MRSKGAFGCQNSLVWRKCHKSQSWRAHSMLLFESLHFAEGGTTTEPAEGGYVRLFPCNLAEFNYYGLNLRGAGPGNQLLLTAVISLAWCALTVRVVVHRRKGRRKLPSLYSCSNKNIKRQDVAGSPYAGAACHLVHRLAVCLTGSRAGWSASALVVPRAWSHTHFCLLKCLASSHPEPRLHVAWSFWQQCKQLPSDVLSQSSIYPAWSPSLSRLDLV